MHLVCSYVVIEIAVRILTVKSESWTDFSVVWSFCCIFYTEHFKFYDAYLSASLTRRHLIPGHWMCNMMGCNADFNQGSAAALCSLGSGGQLA